MLLLLLTGSLDMLLQDNSVFLNSNVEFGHIELLFPQQ